MFDIIGYLFYYGVIYMKLYLLISHVLCCLRLERHLSTSHGSSPWLQAEYNIIQNDVDK